MSILPASRILLPSALVLTLAGAASLVAPGDLRAEEKAKKEAPSTAKKKKSTKKAAMEHDLQAWGTVKEVKGTDFHTLAYTKTEGKKPTKSTAFIKVAGDAVFFQDKIGTLAELKEGDPLWLLGRPVENEQPSIPGQSAGGVDRQIQNVTAIAAGESLRVNHEYKDPRDPKVKWCEAVVAKVAPALHVTYEGGEFRVVMGKQAQVLIRGKAESKAIKSGIQVEVSADKSTERPETKNAADEKKEAFVAKRVVLLDRRLVSNLYPLMLE